MHDAYQHRAFIYLHHSRRPVGSAPWPPGRCIQSCRPFPQTQLQPDAGWTEYPAMETHSKQEKKSRRVKWDENPRGLVVSLASAGYSRCRAPQGTDLQVPGRKKKKFTRQKKCIGHRQAKKIYSTQHLATGTGKKKEKREKNQREGGDAKRAIIAGGSIVQVAPGDWACWQCKSKERERKKERTQDKEKEKRTRSAHHFEQ
jgi:hypothetical protein